MTGLIMGMNIEGMNAGDTMMMTIKAAAETGKRNDFR